MEEQATKESVLENALKNMCTFFLTHDNKPTESAIVPASEFWDIVFQHVGNKADRVDYICQARDCRTTDEILSLLRNSIYGE